MQTKTLVLRPQADRRVKKGHLWVYSNEVNTQQSPLQQFEPGEVAQLTSHSGQLLGLAFVNPHTLICGRLLTREADVAIDEAFIVKRLQQALSLRTALFDGPYYRLCYGDSDGLPGLVVDRFGEICVVQISSAGFDGLLDEVVSALTQVISPEGIVVRNNHVGREREGLEAHVACIGQVPEQLTIVENGTTFTVPATSGQKTGWFYDHRLNRAFLQQCIRGMNGPSVLDVFSYIGGWGVQAAVAGAASVVCVDASESAVTGVQENARLNNMSDVVTAECGKALDVLKAYAKAERQFDVVVLDPPAFIKKRKDQKAGEAAYRHHIELAIRLVKPGGLLVAGSCSMPLKAETLLDITHQAAHKQNRAAQLFFSGSQSPCHPVHTAIPETQYLKALFFRLD